MEIAKLPHFKYHPNAYKANSYGNAVIEAKDGICACCEKSRGFIYSGSVYCEATVESLCPWCIADGSGAKKFNASFQSYIETLEDETQASIILSIEKIDEVMRRTPGYVSWQGTNWLTHCNDCCAFMGDLQEGEYLQLPQATRDLFRQEHSHLDWLSDTEINELPPAHDIAIYQFQCLHCNFVRLYCDMS